MQADRSWAAPSDELLLAAIERAERHSRSDKPGVLLAVVKEHLGMEHHAWTTRRLRPQLEALEATGLVERLRRHGLVVWGVTWKGRRRLDEIRAGGELPPLPESPQHQAWREAREAADNHINEFRGDLRRMLSAVAAVLDARDAIGSDEWFNLGKQLMHGCSQVGSATHCLAEWPEPDDARADFDDEGPRGRRNIRLWNSD